MSLGLHLVLGASSDQPLLTQGALTKLLLFSRLDPALQRKVVQEMYERSVNAGEILIKEGDTGLAATELYVVKSGKFELSCRLLAFPWYSSCLPTTSEQVLQRRQGQSIRVNMKESGDCFGEISLMYDCPRSATVASTTDAVVWVLDRAAFR